MYVCVYSTFSKERVAGDGNQTLGGFRCKLFYTFKEHHHYLICSPAHRKNILEKYNTEMYRRSVQFSHSVISVSLRPHESKHARPPCLSPTPGVYSNSCPSNWWCHPAISSSVVPFSSCPQSLPASGSSPMSQLFASGGQSTGVSASTSVLPMNTQDWSPLEWTGSPCSPRDSQESSPAPQFKSINSSALSFLHSPTLTSIHDHWKNHSLDQMNLCW